MSQPASHETPLRVAVIGAGFFSQFHFEAWQRIAGAEIVAACDLPGTNVAEKMAAQFGPFPVFHDLQQLIESVKPDLLDIVTPPAVHKTQVAIAAAAGINVIGCISAVCDCDCVSCGHSQMSLVQSPPG